MATNSGASTSGLSEAQIASLMSAMRQGIKDGMITLKRELSAEREAADEKLVKKIKLEKAPTFVIGSEKINMLLWVAQYLSRIGCGLVALVRYM